ncbi:MAG: SLC13 family permease [bacterium]|nr:SLC13 family permease [bacterium]
MSNQVLSIIIFMATYLLLIKFRGKALYIVWGSAILLLTMRVITPAWALNAINWNVLGIFFGTMVLAELFVYSGAPAYLATIMLNRTHNGTWALVTIIAFAGILSAVIENVATVFIVAPLALEIARKLKISPVPIIISIAVAANLQGVATMIGDSPSIILATAAKMTFMDFFWMQGRLGIFFAVQLGAIVSSLIVYYLFRNAQNKLPKNTIPVVLSWGPSILIVLLILTLALSSFIPSRPETLPGIISATIGIMALLWNYRAGYFKLELVKLDWQTFFLLAGLFVLVSSLTSSGAIDSLASKMLSASGGSTLTAYIIIILVSMAISAFVDNIPYTLAMLPVSQIMAEKMGVNPLLFMFALVLSASLGGNITPIGASANVTAVGMLRRQGYTVTFLDFFRIGFPVTIAAVTAGTIFIWVVWS